MPVTSEPLTGTIPASVWIEKRHPPLAESSTQCSTNDDSWWTNATYCFNAELRRSLPHHLDFSEGRKVSDSQYERQGARSRDCSEVSSTKLTLLAYWSLNFPTSSPSYGTLLTRTVTDHAPRVFKMLRFQRHDSHNPPLRPMPNRRSRSWGSLRKRLALMRRSCRRAQ